MGLLQARPLRQIYRRHSSLTDNLEGLLPEGDRQKLWELSSDECEGINKPNLEELKDIAQDCDPTRLLRMRRVRH